MAVGQGAVTGFDSYTGLARETTYGTYVTGTAGIDFISNTLRMTKENKVIEEVNGSRVYSDTIGLGRKVEGDIEVYYDPKSTGYNYLLQNALGGAAITSATATGETAGGSAFTHTFTLGNFSATHGSLSANIRKGGSSAGKIFEYSGLRVNEWKLTAELDEAVMMTFSMIGKDETASSNDVSSTIGTIDSQPLSFVSGRVSMESSLASLTSSSYWHVQSAELVVNNNLKADNESRRLGSDTLDVLPPGVAAIELNLKLRFDTTTAINAMVNGTQFCTELEFLGNTLTTSIIRQGLKIQLPKVIVTEAGSPEIGGPDEILTQEVKAVALFDKSSASGFAIKAFVTNVTSGY